MSGKHQNLAIKLERDVSRFRHKSRIVSGDPEILLVERVCEFPVDFSYARSVRITHWQIFGNTPQRVSH